MPLSSAHPDPVQIEVWLHRAGGRRSSAVLRHVDGGIDLEVHDISVLAGIWCDPDWQARAASLTARGQRVRLMHDGLHLLTLGDGVDDLHMRLGSWPPARGLVGTP